jgi:hypothetical protein
MTSELTIRGSIIDSWLERRSSRRSESRVVLQVAPRGQPRDLWIVEAAASLIPDPNWLADLGENLCHGSPVAAFGRMSEGGRLAASRLHLER